MQMTMTHDHRFWDRIAPRYFKSPISKPDIYEEKLRRTQQYLTEGMDILEFGCGTGGTAIRHAPHVSHVHALDISQNMLDIAAGQVANAGVDNITFERADTADFDAPEGRYDAVLALSHLHLLKDPAAAIVKARGLLKPGGLFISSTVCLGDKWSGFRLFIALGRLIRVFPLVRTFKADWLRKQVMDAGFKILDDWQPGKSPAVFLIARAR